MTEKVKKKISSSDNKTEKTTEKKKGKSLRFYQGFYLSKDKHPNNILQ